jgi:hypothetical protein
MAKLSLDRETLAYLAGVVDGEGSFGAYKDPRSECIFTSCKVEMNHKPTCEAFRAEFGGSVLPRRHIGHRACWAWRVYGCSLDAFLDRISPFLRLKRPEAELMREFRRHRANPAAFVAEMRRLKHEQAS